MPARANTVKHRIMRPLTGNYRPTKNEDGQVTAEIVTQGPDEGLCCGTLKLRKTLALPAGRLAEIASEELGTVVKDQDSAMVAVIIPNPMLRAGYFAHLPLRTGEKLEIPPPNTS